MKKAAPIWRIGGGIIGLALLALILLAINTILGTFRLRADLTEDKIYTLSPGTRNILQNLDSPVTIKLFFNSSARETPAPLKMFAREVEHLLREYEIAGRGNIVIEQHDPRPDTEIEEWADRYGLYGQPLGMMGPRLFLGLVAVKAGAYESIPFLDPRQERLLEYNITRLIMRVSTPGRPVLGVMSSLPVMGEEPMPFIMPGQPQPRTRPPWVAFRELMKDYDVRAVPSEAEQIDPEIEVLIVVHPKDFSDRVFYAIDQFLLGGGRLLAFIDPLCLTETHLSRADQEMMLESPPASDLGPLPEAWGISYNPEWILADLAASTQVSQGRQGVQESPVFLTLIGENINESNTVTAQLRSLLMACTGVFSYTDGEDVDGLEIEPLLMSSRQTQIVDPVMVQMGDQWIRRQFESEDRAHILALRLQGHFRTAFPDGKPADSGDVFEDAVEDFGFIDESIAPGIVILAGDVDMLYDHFSVQELAFFGQEAYQPINDNINFMINAVEQLAGGPELSAVRSRGRFERPFYRVLALKREAQEQWLVRERALQQKLEDTRARLEALQSERDGSQRFILSPEQQAEVERFRQEELKTQRELRDVRRNLREGIERLGVRVKVFNILFVPALVCIAGLSFGLYRRFGSKRRLT